MEVPINQILQGNCIEIMKDFPQTSIDLIVADPPFYLPIKQYSSREAKWKPSIAELSIIEPFFRNFFVECCRVLKPDRSLFVFCDCQSYPIFFAQAYDLWTYIRALIWYKGKAHFPLGRNQPFRHSYEMILHGYNRNTFFTKLNRQDVLLAKVVPSQKRVHPAQKPERIIEELILACSEEGDIVLDPMCGSGTTCAVAKTLNRKWLGIDLDPKYVELSSDQIMAFQSKLAVNRSCAQ